MSFSPTLCVFLTACSHHLCHEIAHLFGGAFLHLACDVGVGSQRESCVEMAEHTGYGFHIHAVLEGQRGERMAEIMKSNLRQSRPVQHPVERIKHAVFDELGNSQKETVSFML